MSPGRRWLAGLACTAILACAAGGTFAQAPATGTYEVRRGDTLFAVARKARPDGVTLNQMLVALFRANPAAFPGGNINILEVGTILNIPGKGAVAAIEAAEADRTLRELLAPRPATAAQPAPGPVAATKPSTVPPPKPARAAAGSLSREDAARRYQDGQALEHKGDHQGALLAYLEAGESGHALAQKRLGEIYDKGSPATPRDYQESLRWYEKARAQGVQMSKPLPRMSVH
jgi:pilus assembly protein FimV